MGGLRATTAAEKYRKLLIHLYSLSKKGEKIQGVVRLLEEFKLSSNVSVALFNFPSFQLSGSKKQGWVVTWLEKVPGEYSGQMYFLEKSKELQKTVSRITAERKYGDSQKTRHKGEDIEFEGKRYKTVPESSPKQDTQVISEELQDCNREVEDGTTMIIEKVGDQYKVSLEDQEVDTDEITIRISKKAGRVLLVVLEENQDPVYKKFTEKLSEQIFEQVF